MEFIEFSNELDMYCKKINIELNDKQKRQFYDYMNLLLEWNEKINLTAITQPKSVILKHFIDSIMILSFIGDNSKLIDVGTGAGFPGIPLKILREDLEITLLDSLNKRVNFLNEVISKLELCNIIAIHGRAEELARDEDHRENYDIVTSRAVANLATLSEYMIPFTKLGGKCICMKGSRVR